VKKFSHSQGKILFEIKDSRKILMEVTLQMQLSPIENKNGIYFALSIISILEAEIFSLIRYDRATSNYGMAV